MREGWKYLKLGEIGTFTRCSGILKADFVAHGLPCIHYGQIHTKFGIFTEKHLSEISEELYNKSKIANPGDIVLAITSEDVEGSCKCTAWMGNYDVAVGAHAAILKHHENPKYLSYCFRSKNFFMQKARYARGFKVTEIKPSEVALIEIPVPPLPEQQRIVSELDLLSSIIDKQKAQLKELDTLCQSIFYDMFGDPVENEKGWEVSSYGKEFELGSGGTPSKANPDYWEGGTIPWIGSNMCQNCVVYETDGKYITEEGLEHSSAKLLDPDTVLVALVGATIGKVALLKTTTATNQNIAFIKKTNKFSSIFVFYHMMSLYGEFMKLGNGDFKMASQGFIKTLPIIIPPLPLQHLFAQKIQAIETQKAAISSSLAETQKLFDYTMDKYFG